MNFQIEPATLEQIKLVQQIARQYSRELGFVMLPALREAIERQTLLIARGDGQGLLGFVHFYRRQDGWNTIREIAVVPDALRTGLGKALFDAIPRPVRLKCTVDNDRANYFYFAMGMTLVRVEQGRKRQLNVWELEAAL